jgi:hypothetical protein
MSMAIKAEMAAVIYTCLKPPFNTSWNSVDVEEIHWSEHFYEALLQEEQGQSY